MKPTNCALIAALVLAGGGANSQTGPTSPVLQVAKGTNGVTLAVNSLSTTGAVFIYSGTDLSNTLASPSLLWQTNSPVPESRLPIPAASQGFFFGAYWDGRSTDEFGDPEEYPQEMPPAEVLFTSDLPSNLATGQGFSVDFFVADPSGQPVDISGTASILVVRETDGATHLDAVVIPPTGQMTNGYMRAIITVTSTSPLDGYTLGLNIAPSLQGQPPPLVSDTFLKAAFGLGPAPLAQPQRAYWTQQLAQRRTDNADNVATWHYPASGGDYQVSGTFGEWRGKNNQHVHRGLDLAAPANTSVRASRGGVVSARGTLAGMGDYLVVDHGTGWFSRYLHLDANSIWVHKGQAVTRSSTLATRLYSGGGWPVHLHFEVRSGANQAQWDIGTPGSGQDPVEAAGIFAVPSGVAPPRIEEFGLTRHHPAQTAFIKSAPTATANGAVYLFLRAVDVEPKPDGDYRLGLKSIRFLPEGAPALIEVRARDDAAIDQLALPGTGQAKGFARYSATHAANPDRRNYFHYWWQWDTSSYTTNPIGPRTISIVGEDYSGATTNCVFTFGPQVKGGRIVPVSGQQYLFTNVAFLGTNFSADFAQPDQYKLEIIQASGQPLPGVTWGGPMDGAYTRIFTTHLDEDIYTFTLPSAGAAQGVKLRVSSKLAPDIAHEVCLCSGLNLAYIPPGTFMMGSPTSEPLRFPDETQHTVTLNKGFCMGTNLVTRADYRSVRGSNPSYFVNPYGNYWTRPVEQVSWNDAVAYCAALTAQERAAGRLPAGYVYGLPTEAQWDYACRAGTTTPFHYGNELRSGMANFYGIIEYLVGDPEYYNASGIFLRGTMPVGSYVPNAWGLYDMHGNVLEWCSDWYGEYPAGSVTDPTGPVSGSTRVSRGGSWIYPAYICRSAHRLYPPGYPPDRYYIIGFRVVLAPGQP